MGISISTQHHLVVCRSVSFDGWQFQILIINTSLDEILIKLAVAHLSNASQPDLSKSFPSSFQPRTGHLVLSSLRYWKEKLTESDWVSHLVATISNAHSRERHTGTRVHSAPGWAHQGAAWFPEFFGKIYRQCLFVNWTGWYKLRVKISKKNISLN